MSLEPPPTLSTPPSYTVSAAAALLGVSVHTLRYYEREGLLPVPRDAAGRRKYGDSELNLLRFLLSLRATGMGIERVRKYMMLAREGAGTRAERRELLKLHEAEVTAKLAEVQLHLQTLRHKVEL